MKFRKSTKRLVGEAAMASALLWALACGSSTDDEDNPSSGVGGGASQSGGSTAATGGVGSTTGGKGGSGGSGNTTSSGGENSGGSSSTSGGAAGEDTGGTAGSSSTNGGTAGSSGSTAGSGGTGGSTGGTGGSTGGTGGSTGGTGGKGGSGGTGGSSGAGGSGGTGITDPALAKFSFFVVSYPTIKKLSGKAEGFGGDLRFGKADGLAGADEICRQAAEIGMPGAGQKTWRAFLSVTKGPAGTAVNARDRIGTGPWYDRQGRLFSMDIAGLFAGDRPAGDSALINDLTNESGQPNHYVGPNGLGTSTVDNHDTLTGSDKMGRLASTTAASTCNDWTSTTAAGKPNIGHSWPRSATSGRNWVSDHTVPGCIAGVDRTLGGTGSGNCIGCSGGYGGFFCFAVP